MQSGKWILTSLVMTFFGIPILAQFLAAVVAMLGAGLAAILDTLYANNLSSTQRLYADAGGDNHIFLWSRVGW